MPGLARSTDRCGAIDSGVQKGNLQRMPLTDSMEKPPSAERTAGPIAVFSNSYARLPEHFFARLAPTPVSKPRLIKFNDSLASELGVNASGLEADELAAVFAGNVTPPGAEPIAMAYAGHQFGNFVPQLGDGRAILLGEVLDRNGERRDVQLKGAGERRSRGAETAAPHWGRSCANILSAKRCMRWEFRPHGPWRPSQRAKLSTATASCLEPC